MPAATTPMPKAKKQTETVADHLAALERRHADLTAAFAESREKRKQLVEQAGAALAAGKDPKVERERIDALSGEIEIAADGLSQLGDQIAAARRDLRTEQAAALADEAQALLEAVVERMDDAEAVVGEACEAMLGAQHATQDFARFVRRHGVDLKGAEWFQVKYLLWRVGRRLARALPGLQADTPRGRFEETPASATYRHIGELAIRRLRQEENPDV